MRRSTLSREMVQLPKGSAVWTSSFKAVKRVPSCSATAFSIGSCSLPVWVASPTQHHRSQYRPLTEINPLLVPSQTLTINPSERHSKKVSYPSQIYQRPCDFSFWQSASLLHQALGQPETGPAAVETDLNDDKGCERDTRSDSGISVSQQMRGLELENKHSQLWWWQSLC